MPGAKVSATVPFVHHLQIILMISRLSHREQNYSQKGTISDISKLALKISSVSKNYNNNHVEESKIEKFSFNKISKNEIISLLRFLVDHN